MVVSRGQKSDKPILHVPYHNISPQLVVLLYASIFFLAIFYYIIGTLFFNSPLTFKEYLVFTSVLGVVIVGGYQLFFWTQYHNTKFKTRCYRIWLDDLIPHIPSFIWIYNLSYYVIIGLVLVTLSSLEQGLYYIFGGLILLTVHCIIFYFFPSVVPAHWRDYKAASKAQKFLKFVQKLDRGRNCMPSMHMSVATYVSLLLLPALSYYSFVFIALIGVSCLLVKQHTIPDIAPGIVLGWLVYALLF